MKRIKIVRKDAALKADAEAWLVKTKRGLPPQYFLVSGVHALYSGWEVLIFSCTKEGEVLDWGEVAGRRGISHEEAIAQLEVHLTEED